MADNTQTFENCADAGLSPFSPGKVRCKCLIWNSCPIYERVKQEFMLQLAPETLQGAANYNFYNYARMSGSDGTFLQTIDNFYLDTYLAEWDGLRTYQEQIENFAGNPEGLNAVNEGRSWVRFLRKQKPDDKNYSVPIYLKLSNYKYLTNWRLTTGNTHLTITDGKITSGNAIGSHQTFVVHQSLYSTSNLKFANYNLRHSFLTEDDVFSLFLTQWSYKQENLGNTKTYLPSTALYTPTTGTNGVSKLIEDSRFLAPVTLGIDAVSDPVKTFETLGYKDAQDKLFNSDLIYELKNVNPGMHWGLAKRLMLAPNQGFSLSFFAQTDQPNRLADPKQKYKMLPEFDWLDPFQSNKTSDCAGYDAIGNYDKDQFARADAERKRIYNLAGQVYIVVQFPLDSTKEIFGGKRQKLFLVIAENIPPTIYRTEGYQPRCKQKAGSTTVSVGDCGDVSEQSVSSSTRATYVWEKGAIQISTCDFVSSSELLSRKHIKINCRVHLGKLIITFGGYEGAYWVVTNTITKPPVKNADVTTSSTENKQFPFNFTLSNLAVYSGNKKFSFNYTPIIYKENSYTALDRVTISGPALYDEVEFLLREKKSPNFLLGNKVYTAPYYQSNYALKYWEKTFTERPENKTSCNYDNAFNLTTEQKDQGKKDAADSAANPPKAELRIYSRPDTSFSPNQDAFALGLNEYVTEIQLYPSNCYVQEKVMVKKKDTEGNEVWVEETRNIDPKFDKSINTNIKLKAGALFLPDIDQFGEDVWLENADTPILSNVRVNVHEKGCAWNKMPVDVSDYVMSFSDDWSETDFQKIAHSGNITFYLKNSNDPYDVFYKNFLYNLADKTFYLQISLYWDNQLAKTTAEWENLDTDRIVFTGLCHGGTYTIENNKETLACTLYDYSKILQDQVFFNSPFFDRMADIFAISEILKLAGLRDGGDNWSTYEPGSFIKMCTDNYDRTKNNSFMDFIFNGEKVKVRNFVLPGSFDLLQSPLLKFGDDTPLWGAIEKISLMSSKIAYFDRFGVFRYENMPFDNYLYSMQNSVQDNPSLREQEALNNVYERAKNNCYVVSLRDVAEYGKKKAEDKKNKKETSKDQMNCAGDTVQKAYLQAIESYTFDRIVGDVKNEIRVITATPNGELLIAADVNRPSLYDADSVGFVGYKKTFIQMDGIFGSEETLKMMVKHYTKMYIPPMKISFKAIGRNKLKALDVITFQGLGNTSDQKQPLIITSIKNEVNAESNKWYQTIEALWLFSGKNVAFGRTNTIGIGLDGSVSNK